MAVEHDLKKDFPELADEFTRRMDADRDFAALVKKYEELDKRILKLESNPISDDDQLNRLRRERVLEKDRIGQRLQYR